MRLAVPLALGGIFAFLASRAPVSDSDLFWHLALGREIASGGLPRVDTFSWTIAGRPILTDQWLGELFLYWSYAFGSWRGIVTLRALAVGAITAIVVASALAERPRRPLIAVLASLPALALSRFAWTDRPELFGLLCFAACVALLGAARRGSVRALAATVPLLGVWANLHGSYALGLGLVVLALVVRAASDAGERTRSAVFAVAACAATLVTPAGLGTWTSSGGHFLAPPRFIQEEGTPDVATLPGAIFAVCLVTVLATALLAPRGEARRTIADLVLLLPVAFVSLSAQRHLVFFPIAAAPYLAARAPDAVARLAVLVPGRFWRTGTDPVAPRTVDIAAAAIAALLVVAAGATAPTEPDLSGYPTGALASVSPGPGLLNRYEWGGFLIWYAPATPVFLDGRLFPYVGDALDDYRAVIGLHANWRDVVRRRGIRALLVGPGDAVAVRGVEMGWRVLARSSEFVLLAAP